MGFWALLVDIRLLLYFVVCHLSRAKLLCWILKGGGAYTKICYEYKIGKRVIFQKIKYKRFLSLYHGFSDTKKLLDDPNLAEKIATLCAGLDSESRNVVARILSRIRELDITNKNQYFNLSQEERDELTKIRKDFYPRIYQAAPNLYSYNGYFLSTYFFEISVLWHRHNLEQAFSQATLERIKQKDIIDVGSCVGDSALVFQDFTDNNIYAFEPTNQNYEHLLKTIKLNNATRIIPVKKALGSKASQGEISLSKSNLGGASLIFNHHTTSHSVEIITLDSFVKEHNLRVGFIKVDIEGFEQEFLAGAKQTICEQKPAILLSIYHTMDDFFNIKPMIESWNLGYKFKIIKPIDFSVLTETALYCEV